MAKTKKKPPARKAPTPRSGLGTQAQLEAFVRYGGQLGELARMARDTRSEGESRARDSVAAGEAISQSARRSQPEMKQIYDQSLGEMSRREGNMRSELAKLGPAADPYKAGGLFTSTTAQNRTSGERSSALKELVGRQQDATSGARYGAQQARSQASGEVSKIREKMLDVQAESGAFQAGRVGELKEGQRGRALEKRGQDKTAASQRASRKQSDRNSQRSAGIDPKTGQPIEGGSLDPKTKKPKGPKLQTSKQHEGLRSRIDAALMDARVVAKTQGRGATTQDLRNPFPSSTKTTDDGTTVNIPGREGFSGLVAAIAVDLAYDGRITKKNVRRLHESKYSLRTLGLADQTEGVKGPKRKPKGKAGKGVQQGGKNIRPGLFG